MKEETKTMTASGLIYSGPGYMTSVLIGGLDGVNDVQLTIYDALTTPAGTEEQKFPTNKYDCDGYYPTGAEKQRESLFKDGLYLVCEDVGGGAMTGTVTVVVGRQIDG